MQCEPSSTKGALDPFEFSESDSVSSESDKRLGTTVDDEPPPSKAVAGKRKHRISNTPTHDQASRSQNSAYFPRRGTSFKFSGMWNIPENYFCNDSSQEDRTRLFKAHVCDRLRSTNPYSSITFMLISFDARQFAPLHDSVKPRSVAIIGYIQSSAQIYLKTLTTWMNGELEWKLIHGELFGCADYTSDILAPNEHMVREIVLGQFRLNNAGRESVLLLCSPDKSQSQNIMT